MLRVLEPGPLTAIQDHGRSGWLDQGVARSGAFDRSAMDLANRLVGNHPDAACLEILAGGCRIEATGDCVVALTGTDGPGSIDRRRAVRLGRGEQVAIGMPTVGVRTYLAIRGGIGVPSVLDSCSWDSLGHIGPQPLAAGDLIRAGDRATSSAPWFEAVPPARRLSTASLVAGPHLDLCHEGTWDHLAAGPWRIGTRCDRVGVQLVGPRLIAPSGGMASFPVLPGSVQLPPDGQPFILGPDAGTTGGYPVIAVVDLGAVAQSRPGDRLRFGRR